MPEDYNTEYIREIYERNVDDIYKLCFSYLKNVHDCEDAVSAVFVKLMKNKPVFQSYKQEKAWLIITACNHCKSVLRFLLRHPKIDIASLPEQEYWDDSENSEMLEIVLSLPKKYRIVLYLHYYEGYSLVEISKIINENESTVRSRLFYGKKKLLKLIGGTEYEKIYRINGTYPSDRKSER